jgi:hypothetical protein
VYETGQPYAYAGDDPVDNTDPTGASIISSAWDDTGGQVVHGVKTAAVDTGHFFSDPNRWRNEANYWAGVGNGIVSTVTLGQVGISEPYCGSLPWAYDVGTGFGFALTAVGGGVAIDAIRGAVGAGEGIDIAEGQAGHIFRDAPGHLADDTAANRELLQQTAGNPDNYVGTDSNGVATYRQNLPNGTQVWAEVKGGQITNGGVNDVPR